MKSLPVIALILIFCSCSTLRKVADPVCDVQTSVAKEVTKAGEFFGGPGAVVATVFNGAMRLTCSILDGTANAAADLLEAGPKAIGLLDEDDTDN